MATTQQIASPGTYFTNDVGVEVTDGTYSRVKIGVVIPGANPSNAYGLGFTDPYGNPTYITGSGFGPSYMSLIQSGIYNNMFQQAVPGTLALGISRDDATGHTTGLPYWTAWSAGSSFGTATVVADTTWPGGNYVKFTFATTGSSVSGNVALTNDLSPVMPLDQWNTDIIRADNIPAGVTLNCARSILWYDSTSTYISTSSDTSTYTSGHALTNFGGSAFIAPSNARYARLELNVWETVLHSASTYFELGAVALTHTGNGNVGTVYQINAGTSISAGTSVTAGSNVVSAMAMGLLDSGGTPAGGIIFGTPVDTQLYRSAAGVLTTPNRLAATDGVTSRYKAGTISDADFVTTPPNGTIAVDGTDGRIYFRYGGAWHYVNKTL
jgi:hypothetical protein